MFNEFPKSYQDELVRRQAELDLLALAVNELGPPEQAARAYYDNNKDDFAQACVSHILVADEEQGQRDQGPLDAGEDFAAVGQGRVDRHREQAPRAATWAATSPPTPASSPSSSSPSSPSPWARWARR